MSAEAVIVFDGTCVLCSGWVRFLLRHDRRARYRFAAMQSAAGAQLLAQHGLDPQDPLSFLLIEENGSAWVDSSAVLRVLAGLGGAWRAFAFLRVVPRGWRDRAYRWLARHRYRWFGRHALCLVPTPALRERFLA